MLTTGQDSSVKVAHILHCCFPHVIRFESLRWKCKKNRYWLSKMFHCLQICWLLQDMICYSFLNTCLITLIFKLWLAKIELLLASMSLPSTLEELNIRDHGQLYNNLLINRVALNFRFGFGKFEIRPFFPNSAKFGFGQISGRIWQMPMQLQCAQLVT